MMGITCGLLEHGQKTHDEMLSDGLACAKCAASVGGSYQRFLALWVHQTCSAKAENVQGSSSESVSSQTTCGSKSRKWGSYLVVTAMAVYAEYYPRLLGMSTA